MGVPVTAAERLGPKPEPSALSGVPSSEVERESSNLEAVVKPLGAFMTEDHRYYWNGKGPYPSVTTVLKVLDKPAVTRWYGREIGKAAWAQVTGLGPNGEAVTKFPGGDVDDWVRFLEAQPREITDVAAKLGTSVHLLAEMEGRAGTRGTGFDMPEEAFPYLEAFRGFLAFLRAQGGEIVSSEHAVFSLTEGYAGTYDLLVKLPAAGLWLIDVKTSRGYYPEFALQIAAYGHAEFIALEGDPTPYPMPPIDRYGVLHLRPDTYTDTGWRLVEYPIRDTDYLAFLAALYIYQWKGEGRFTKSILQKAIYAGELDGIGPDPLTTE